MSISVKTQLVMRTYLENLPIDATAILHERVSTAYYHPEQDETATDLLLCDFTELAEERLAEALSAVFGIDEKILQLPVRARCVTCTDSECRQAYVYPWFPSPGREVEEIHGHAYGLARSIRRS